MVKFAVGFCVWDLCGLEFVFRLLEGLRTRPHGWGIDEKPSVTNPKPCLLKSSCGEKMNKSLISLPTCFSSGENVFPGKVLIFMSTPFYVLFVEEEHALCEHVFFQCFAANFVCSRGEYFFHFSRPADPPCFYAGATFPIKKGCVEGRKPPIIRAQTTRNLGAAFGRTIGRTIGRTSGARKDLLRYMWAFRSTDALEFPMSSVGTRC